MVVDAEPVIRVEDLTVELDLDVQFRARELVKLCAVDGLFIRVISGRRSWAEQDALYRKGREDLVRPYLRHAEAELVS